MVYKPNTLNVDSPSNRVFRTSFPSSTDILRAYLCSVTSNYHIMMDKGKWVYIPKAEDLERLLDALNKEQLGPIEGQQAPPPRGPNGFTHHKDVRPLLFSFILAVADVPSRSSPRRSGTSTSVLSPPGMTLLSSSRASVRSSARSRFWSFDPPGTRRFRSFNCLALLTSPRGRRSRHYRIRKCTCLPISLAKRRYCARLAG